MAYWVDVEVQIMSVTVLLCWLKLLDYLSAFRQFARLVVMIELVSLAPPGSGCRRAAWLTREGITPDSAPHALVPGAAADYPHRLHFGTVCAPERAGQQPPLRSR
jgi:hypothetical protein